MPDPNIHLWHVELAEDADADRYLPLLDDTELAHAHTLSHPLIRQRYLAVRGNLRLLLADYLQQAPAAIGIARTETGKPYLPAHPQTVFNISHTARHLIVAIAGHCQLGIDIELPSPRPNLAALVKKCFADEEAAYWHGLPPTRQTLEFYRFWTKKEAFVKATGRGIALGLKHCVINPEQPETFLRLPDGYGAATTWRIIDLTATEQLAGHGLCGAVVVDSLAQVSWERLVKD